MTFSFHKLIALITVSAISLAFICFNAYADAPQLKPKAEIEKDAQKLCTKNYTKRGELDQEMYSYCVKDQMEWYEELVELHKYADKTFYSDIAFPYCEKIFIKRGVINAKMMAVCLDQEVEGYKDVQYYKERGGEKVNLFVKGALPLLKSWNLTAYQVKHNFDID